MTDKDAAAAAKAKGNAALSAKDFQAAVTHYTEAIGHDAGDHVFYSNRSAAYASLQDFANALKDGQKCMELKPDFAKGYGRAGAAFHGMGQFKEAVAAYESGLKVDSGNAMLQQGLAAAQQQAQAMDNPIAKLFSDPNVYAKLAMDPTTKPYMSQPDFLQKLQQIQQNPAMIQMYMQSDPRIQAALGVMLGVGGMGAGPPGGGDPGADASGATAGEPAPPPAPPPAKEPEPPPEPPKELTEEEKARAEVVAKAEAEKKIGVGHYSAAAKLKKEPEKKKAEILKALEHFTAASEIDPENMAYLSNRSACYYELKDYDKAIEESQAAVKIGKEVRADFALMAKAYARIGNCYASQKKYAEAIEFFDHSLMEDEDEKVRKKLAEIKKAKRKKDAEDFLDDGISEEEKAKGAECFKAGDYKTAIKHYTEAIARNPKNHLLYSNRCTCFRKINQFEAALADCEKCIEICPAFAKIYNSKGQIQFYLKNYHRCIETFQKVIELEPESQGAIEATEMIQKTHIAIRAASSGPVDEQQQQRAMQDPEVQAIMADPQIRGMLQNLQAGGQPAQEAQRMMQDSEVARKINVLIAAGVLKTG